ncbi:hypothetical protein GCM10009827_101100 [Dactylosporangium maewongense]|uniref:Type I-U CRISPR-associated protein Csx17 n=1 Tax=Dactylosporangium maewongense TaxID=634393 RepID=A0ABP4NNL8_9ACTN
MITMAGCRTVPIGSYLQGLGMWRAVVRLLDPEAKAHWHAGRLVLSTHFSTADELIEALAGRFEPLPIASPWNAGAGYTDNGSNTTATGALAAVRSSSEPRLARLRAVVEAADRVTAEAHARGWSGTGKELWDKARKPDVMQLCRNEFPDDALAWIDAAVVLGRDERGRPDPTYSRLLGTGGNFGRQDVSSTYVQAVLAVLVKSRTAKQSGGWLRAALVGDESVPYLRNTVGQLDPGRAGGVQSSPLENDDEGFANPWAFLFAIEGAVLFASAAVRREGALTSRVAVPFAVDGSAGGFATDADGEPVRAEMWMPEWSRPATLAEIEHLLGEGRVEWGGRPARTGLDFVRAVATLGVDRGITHFTRHIVTDRFGQSPLAVPAGRIAVRDHAGPVGLLGALDRWLDDVRAVTRSGEVTSRMRQLDVACFDVSRGGGPAAMRTVIIALGRLHEAVANSSAARERVRRPLVVADAAGWWAALGPDLPELRLAAAFASGSDADLSQPVRFGSATLRCLLSPVRPAHGGKRLEWSDRPSAVAVSGGTVAALAAAHRRRGIPGAVSDPFAGDTARHRPVIKGVLSAFRRGLHASLSDVVALAAGEVDDALLGDYLRGLVLLDWSTAPLSRLTIPGDEERPFIPAPLALLLPFFAVDPLPIRLRRDDPTDTAVVLRPGPGWLTGLRSSDPAGVYTDALRRLGAAGITRTVTHVADGLDGDAVTAALLLRMPRGDRLAALRSVAVLPARPPARVLGEPA